MDRAELSHLVHATGCATAHGDFVFLADPKWNAAERERAEHFHRLAEATSGPVAEGWLCIPTGGSSGAIRFVRHDERTLTAAAHGFCAHFGVDRVNAIGVLPAFHVSGLMACIRCKDTNGAYRDWSWKRLEAGELPELGSAGDWFISLVPTQLERLLGQADAADWLRRFRAILVGGGPAWLELAERGAAAKLPLSFCYGSTETAAMATALQPAEFLRGERSCGRALPHMTVRVVDPVGKEPVEMGKTGLITVSGASSFRGYFGQDASGGGFTSEDLGWMDREGGLHVEGRRDAVIVTGGEKVFPAEVEAVLRDSGEFGDVAVLGVPDPQWGERVVACYPAAGREPNWTRVKERLNSRLAGYKHPKRYVAVDVWPRNDQGKVKRAALLNLAHS
jgi:O-succinylbenzoic acid--CoA ligase